MRCLVALSLLSVATLACAKEPAATLRSAFGGARLEAIGHFDYRLRTEDGNGVQVASADHRLLPATRRLYVRECDGEVWSRVRPPHGALPAGSGSCSTTLLLAAIASMWRTTSSRCCPIPSRATSR